MTVDLLTLRRAIEMSWSASTAYSYDEYDDMNPAGGQCYPTAAVLNEHYPNLIIVRGRVRNSETGGLEIHFWNLDINSQIPVDWTWQQFPLGSRVTSWNALAGFSKDGDAAKRVTLLSQKVKEYLG